MLRMHLGRIDQIDRTMTDLEERIDEVMTPFVTSRELLMTIPGIPKNVANTLSAEAGTDMTAFPTAGHLTPWVGVCPGQNESAGRVSSAHTRPGNHYLKAGLGIAALSISRSKTTYLAVKYRRIQSRAGAMRAVVAIENALLVIAWNMLTRGVAYEELGVDEYDRTNPERTRRRLLRRMESLGFQPVLTPLPIGTT